MTGIGLTLVGTSWAQSGAALPPLPPKETVVFPLSEVKRGLRGVAYTVFEGVNPEPMEVEILGLLNNALGAGQDMILARLHGTKPEYTGVVAGMSGSPVYIDGRLVGALSFRIGQFSKEPIAGITPIERMLELRDGGAGGSRLAQLGELSTLRQTGDPSAVSVDMTRLSVGGGSSENGEVASRSGIGPQLLTPIETPLVFGGFSQEAVDRFGDRFKALGLAPVAGLGGSNGTEKQPESLMPGSAVSAILVRGDLSMAGTCTVTYMDATHLLACGHPITQFGSVSMPMTKATVLATLPSPLNAFKIINTTETVGAFTEDRTSAIMGRFGQQARMIPVTVAMTGGETHAKDRTMHFEVLDNRELTPSAMLVSIFQSLQQNNTAQADASYRLSGELTIQGQPAVRLDGIMAPNESNPAAINTALFVGERFGRIYANAEEQPIVQALNLKVESIGPRRTAVLEQARLSRKEVRAGEALSVEITLDPFQAAATVLRIPVVIPAGTPPGDVRVAVSDGSTADRLTDLQSGQRRPVPLRDAIDQINRSHPNDRIYVTLLTHEAQAVLEGGALGEVPLSMANVLEPLKGEQRVQLTGETAVELGSAPTGHSISGMQVLSVKVR